MKDGVAVESGFAYWLVGWFAYAGHYCRRGSMMSSYSSHYGAIYVEAVYISRS
jgi:hypothetical protein